jgi:chemotaxis-related protein WspD
VNTGSLPVIDACWRRIGVSGDRSCPELSVHIHCRNCPAHNEAARRLLDRPLPRGYREDWAATFAVPPPTAASRDLRTAIVFRVAAEWFGWPSAFLHEVITRRPAHSIPHRHSQAVLGLINVRGELLILVSLPRLLGVSEETVSTAGRVVFPRLLVVGAADRRIAFAVDEVHGLVQFGAQDLTDVPATLAGTQKSQSTAILRWNGEIVGLLDPARLLPSIERIIA